LISESRGGGHFACHRGVVNGLGARFTAINNSLKQIVRIGAQRALNRNVRATFNLAVKNGIESRQAREEDQ
jgi:hypothetical protein